MYKFRQNINNKKVRMEVVNYYISSVDSHKVYIEIREKSAFMKKYHSFKLNIDPKTSHLRSIYKYTRGGPGSYIFKDSSGSPFIDLSFNIGKYLHDWIYISDSLYLKYDKIKIKKKALDEDNYELYCVVKSEGKNIEIIQKWKKGMPFWDESKKIINGDTVVSAYKIIKKDIKCEKQAVFDPVSGIEYTAEFFYYYEKKYYRSRNLLFTEYDSLLKIKGISRDSIFKVFTKKLDDLQNNTKNSIKNILSDNLKSEFYSDRQKLKLIKESVIRPEKTLEEIYREEREREGEVIIPPMINTKFKNKVDRLKSHLRIDSLIILLKAYKNLSLKNPGDSVSGNIILGAPMIKYFSPSEESKRTSYIGKSIENTVLNIKTKDSLILLIKNLLSLVEVPTEIIYDYYCFYYVDVVGSGRFFYPNEPQNRNFKLVKIIIENSIPFIANDSNSIEMSEKPALTNVKQNNKLLRRLLKQLSE